MDNKAKRFLQTVKNKVRDKSVVTLGSRQGVFCGTHQENNTPKCNTQARINQGTFSTNRRLIPWKMGVAQVKRAYPIDPMGLGQL